jgi:hypothetical protein
LISISCSGKASLVMPTREINRVAPLDGRDATTQVSRLRELHPTVNVLEKRLFAEDGKIFTSAGGGAGIRRLPVRDPLRFRCRSGT